jgi:hypothetical protein
MSKVCNVFVLCTGLHFLEHIYLFTYRIPLQATLSYILPRESFIKKEKAFLGLFSELCSQGGSILNKRGGGRGENAPLTEGQRLSPYL